MLRRRRPAWPSRPRDSRLGPVFPSPGRPCPAGTSPSVEPPSPWTRAGVSRRRCRRRAPWRLRSPIRPTACTTICVDRRARGLAERGTLLGRPRLGPPTRANMELTSGPDSQLLLGRYRVVSRLAEGGMGKVYLARVEGAEGFTKPVVVKVMRPDMRAMEDGNRLFSREALILSKMRHPAVPGILDFGTQDGARIMVLDYVHGYSLANWLDFRFSRGQMIPVD